MGRMMHGSGFCAEVEGRMGGREVRDGTAQCKLGVGGSGGLGWAGGLAGWWLAAVWAGR